eukprot:CAMPEP_0185614388 /NCGR_PEP_ID=MMETSP0436-20130131/31388_1 /TAXON_ID=626734 ORGANISM="Favella taraikaensis, Strain Fe Narragansett Bay" /NCGR_SAMPLE_ID=MMETSP0436 /ASSEMBLY_ACC=CAM_ASM_000390 /LENGTH=86 /DNA_ID=CAMNT_0028249157 /DNA_START=121 /DNA_END=381 /DNA_ORIENTATION=-
MKVLRAHQQQSQPHKSRRENESSHGKKVPLFKSGKQQAQPTVYERMIRARASSALNLVENEPQQQSARGIQSRIKNDYCATKSREF